MVIILTAYSVLNSCTVEFINYSIILFTGLPLKGAIDKNTLSINLLFIQGLKRKLKLGIIGIDSRFWESLSSVLFLLHFFLCSFTLVLMPISSHAAVYLALLLISLNICFSAWVQCRGRGKHERVLILGLNLRPASMVIPAARVEHLVQLCSWNAMCLLCIWLPVF